MNANMAALDMVRKPKVEIEEVMYPDELDASMANHPDAAQDMAMMQGMEGMQGEEMPPMPMEDPRMKKPMMPMR